MNYRKQQEPLNTMNQEQFAKVLEAILDGKYSWACVLMLRFSGYNPVHYIPYRTYNRLLNENEPSYQDRKKVSSKKVSKQNGSSIRNLNHLEPVAEGGAEVRGGRGTVEHIAGYFKHMLKFD